MHTAITRVITMLDGKRVTIEPGESIPEGIHRHDLKELEAMGSIARDSKANEQEDDVRQAQKAGAAQFNAIKDEIAQGKESLKHGDAPPAQASAPAQPGQDAGIEAVFNPPKPEAKPKKATPAGKK